MPKLRRIVGSSCAIGVLIGGLAGCAVTTERAASDYPGTFTLTTDTKVWTDCRLWTSAYSLNIGGPENVYCFVSERYNTPPLLSAQRLESDKLRMTTLSKGSVVRIKRVFKIVHSGETHAEMLVTDAASGQTIQVYAEYWPSNNPHLLSPK